MPPKDKQPDTTPATTTAVTSAPETAEAPIPVTKDPLKVDLDPKVAALLPWTLAGFTLEQNTRPYSSKDMSEKTMRIAVAHLRLKGSSDDAPFYTSMTLTYVQPAGQKSYVRAALPASQRAGGAYAVGAIRCESAAGNAAIAAFKAAMLSGPFAAWSKTQDLAGLLKRGATSINTGVEMDLGGFSL